MIIENKKQAKKLPKTESFILPQDQKSFEKYIESKNSDSTKRHVSQNIYFFYGFIRDNFPKIKSIRQVSGIQYRDYFDYLDKQPITRICKVKYKQSLRNYIYYLILPDLLEGKDIPYNYEIIFLKLGKFRDTGYHRAESPLSRQDVFDCLSFFRNRNYRDYILFSLLAFTGMRVGGVTNIRLQDIEIEHRKITTQEKQTEYSSGQNSYCIPKRLIPELKGYIQEISMLYPEQETLFTITPKQVRKQLKHWKVKDTHPHAFRDAINSRWEEMSVEESLRSILLNQEPKGINSKHYLKKYRVWEHRLETFDRYFPY